MSLQAMLYKKKRCISHAGEPTTPLEMVLVSPPELPAQSDLAGAAGF